MVSAVSTLFVASAALAHIQLTSPPQRGTFDEVAELTGPCGVDGNPAPSSRNTIALGASSTLALTVADKNAVVNVNAAIGANPQSFPISLLKNKTASVEKLSLPIDFGAIPGLKGGDLVTLQITELADDGQKFVCVDYQVTGSSTGGSSTTAAATTTSAASSATAPKSTGGAYSGAEKQSAAALLLAVGALLL
ncbi:hypothetical protein HDU91_003586 [Kappamyces sp. JEL0680]|nr:hypothetical protein HDU91_003586 [Kappamyces sp. JEL0680]